MRRPIRQAAMGAITLLAAFSVVPASAAAETFTVNKRGDHVPGACTPDDCTLREAAIAATDLPGNDKVLLPERKKPYRITRSGNLPGPDEANGDIDVGNSFFVFPENATKFIHKGKGKAKIDASKADDRALDILGSVTLKKILVKKGNTSNGSGGNVLVEGTLFLKKSRVTRGFSAFTGGGVWVDRGSLVATDSLIDRNRATGDGGGGIKADPHARYLLERTTVRNNVAQGGDGGGMLNEAEPGTAQSTVIESTVSGNRATGDGGGVALDAAAFRAENSTIAANSAAGRGGGMFIGVDTDSFLRSVTIARNAANTDGVGATDRGGGIYANGGSEVLDVRNSLLALNTVGVDSGARNDCSGSAPPVIESDGGNLISSASQGCGAYFGHPQDLLAGKPRIGELKSKGGPTQTIPLRKNSPAINQADGDFPPERDQRGVKRKNPDIGAYERR